MSHIEQPIAPEMLDRFVDDALDVGQKQNVLDAAAKDPALQAQIDEKMALREALSSHLLQAAEAVDFSGFTDRLLARIDAEEALQPASPSSLGLWQRVQAGWRQHAWVYALSAAAAAALIMMILPVDSDTPVVSQPIAQLLKNDPQPQPDHVAKVNDKADGEVDIENIDTGSRLAMVYQMPDSNTTMIWISDNAETSTQGSL